MNIHTRSRCSIKCPQLKLLKTHNSLKPYVALKKLSIEEAPTSLHCHANYNLERVRSVYTIKIIFVMYLKSKIRNFSSITNVLVLRWQFCIQLALEVK